MLTTAPNTFTAEGRARRALPVEEALRWCVRDELPKRSRDQPIKAPPTASMHPMWRGGIFGGRIDCWSREPGMPLAMGEPHPDALLIEAEILALDAAIKRAAEAREPLPLNLDGYQIGYRLGRETRANQIAYNAVLEACGWLITHAVKGKRPSLDETVHCEQEIGPNGKVVLWRMVSTPAGVDAQGRPLFITSPQRAASKGDARDAGLYCRLVWGRDQNDVAEDRARYAAEHAALCYLADRLGHLTSLKVTPPRAPAAPWLSGPTEPATVRPSLLPVNDDLAPAKVATLPPRKRKPEPVRHIDPAAYAAAA